MHLAKAGVQMCQFAENVWLLLTLHSTGSGSRQEKRTKKSIFLLQVVTKADTQLAGMMPLSDK